MPFELYDLEIDEISFVDNPANVDAKILFFKRDDEVEKGETLMKRLGTMETAAVQKLFAEEPETYWTYVKASRRRGPLESPREQAVVKIGPVTARVLAAAKKLVEDNPALTMAQALARVFASTPGLFVEYRREAATGQSKPLPWPDGGSAA